jgi:hypothetical protein
MFNQTSPLLSKNVVFVTWANMGLKKGIGQTILVLFLVPCGSNVLKVYKKMLSHHPLFVLYTNLVSPSTWTQSE